MARTPGRTPGVLNPLMYEKESDFRKSLIERGKSRGWTRKTQTPDAPTPPKKATE